MIKYVYRVLFTTLLTAVGHYSLSASECTGTETSERYGVENAQGSCQQEKTGPFLSLDSMEHDFGTLQFKSEPRTVVFRFSNTGDAPLVITRTEQSCTCLSVKYPRQPIMPGEYAEIEIAYSPKKDTGFFNNYVKIFSNASDGKAAVVFVRGEVVR